jgi:hypothetical protein
MVKVQVDVPPERLEATVDEDIAAFDVWFQQQADNAPLVGSERAILKTYLYFKTHETSVPTPSPTEERHGA